MILAHIISISCSNFQHGKEKEIENRSKEIGEATILDNPTNSKITSSENPHIAKIPKKGSIQQLAFLMYKDVKKVLGYFNASLIGLNEFPLISGYLNYKPIIKELNKVNFLKLKRLNSEFEENLKKFGLDEISSCKLKSIEKFDKISKVVDNSLKAAKYSTNKYLKQFPEDNTTDVLIELDCLNDTLKKNVFDFIGELVNTNLTQNYLNGKDLSILISTSLICYLDTNKEFISYKMDELDHYIEQINKTDIKENLVENDGYRNSFIAKTIDSLIISLDMSNNMLLEMLRTHIELETGLFIEDSLHFIDQFNGDKVHTK